MGMDGVEITMATEEAFDIQLSDAEAELVMTPRQLIELVERKLGISDSHGCISRQAFHRVRRGLLAATTLRRSEVRPETSLASVLAGPGFPNRWQNLAVAVGASHWPQLQISSALHSFIWLASLAVGTSAMLTLSYFFGDRFLPSLSTSSLLSLLALTVVLAGMAYRFLPLPQAALPSSVRTARDLARWLTANDPTLLSPSSAWTHERVVLKVREIVCDVLCCEERYCEDARFVEDLGLS
jgi:hypothetical protein